MKLEKARLNPNAVNNKAPVAKGKVIMTGNRKATHASRSKGMSIPSTMGFVGKKIR